MDSDEFDHIPLKKSRTLSDEHDICIICCSKAKKGELASPRDLLSWETLLEAAKIREFEPIVNLRVSSNTVPDICYHRNCRSSFTLKKTLDGFKTNSRNTSAESITPEHEQRKSQRQVVAGTSRVLEKKCIFCNKASKYMRQSNSREPLMQSSELRSDEKIRNAAELKMDRNILAITSRELVAAEAHYHKSCYKDYTRKRPIVEGSNTLDDNSVLYLNAEQDAYNMLFTYIREVIFLNPRVFTITEITEQLVSYMNGLGIDEVKPSTKKHMRRKLEGEFKDSINIFPDQYGKLIVVPSNLSITQLAVEYQELKEEHMKYKNVSSHSVIEIVNKAANCIRFEIKVSQRDDAKQQAWPPHPDQLDSEYDYVPPILIAFLQTLLSGDNDNNTGPSMKISRLINSFSQDLIYAVSGGMWKTAKHILLPWSVKTLTGNVELISLLNRLGHGISYSKLEEIETALCLQKIESDGGLLPSKTNPCIPTTLAFDNIDRLDETLSGGGTSHRVNGIIVQPKIHTVQFERPKICLNEQKQKRRSISPIPTMLKSYNAGDKTGPPILICKHVHYDTAVTKAKSKNLTWSLVRLVDVENQKINGWTGFNIRTRNNVSVSQDSIGYLPTVNAPATNMSTVHEVLDRAVKIKDALDIEELVCVFDQALYSKAAEIKWKHPDEFNAVILRMGAFHTICNLLAIIGKRFKDAGLRDIVVESGIIAEGSIDRVMEGRKYNRGVRLHKLIYEALLRLMWKGFFVWFKERHPEKEMLRVQVEALIDGLHQNTTQESFDEILHHPSWISFIGIFNDYVALLLSDGGDLVKFWVSYVEMVDVLLNFIWASREGDWMLHLSAVHSLLPWCFAYDRLNYSRYLAVYYADMSKLPDDHPAIHKQLTNGGFSVQTGDKNPFGRIPVDQTIEETVNKDTQTPGGTKGFSLNPAAVSRYYLTAEHRSTCLKQLRSLTETKTPSFTHPDFQQSRTKRDEQDVTAVVDLLESEWINPFDGNNSDIVNISTGIAAPPDVVHDLLNARSVGESAYQIFQSDRLEKQNPKFHDTLPKHRLKTFSDVKKQRKTRLSNKETVLRADHKLFGRMLLIAASRHIDISEVLAHPLGPIHWSLANNDGSLKKTNKASLARFLEKKAAAAHAIPTPSACIIDGMSLLQKIHGDNMTFNNIAMTLFNSALHIGSESDRIDVVFDVYTDMSIKNAERIKRGSESGILFGQIVPGHKIKQWRRLLASPQSKTKLVEFLVSRWKETIFRQKLNDKVMYVTLGKKCFQIMKDATSDVSELCSEQEEADTRMLLHAKHAALTSSSVIIVADDTDVFILCLAFCNQIECRMFLKCGTKSRERYIDVNQVAAAVGVVVCKALPGMHAFTGCDTVSAFAGRGKIGAMKLLQGNVRFQEAFTQLGKDWSLSTELFGILQEFTCRMYAMKSQVSHVNDMRYLLFRAKYGDVDSGQLPPCEDCLLMHAKRANYQNGIWNRSLTANCIVPNPTDGHGWNVENGSLIINWMTGLPAPEVVLDFMSCKCRKECKLPDCECLVNGISCMASCKLQTCTNMREDDLEMSNRESADESSEYDSD